MPGGSFVQPLQRDAHPLPTSPSKGAALTSLGVTDLGFAIKACPEDVRQLRLEAAHRQAKKKGKARVGEAATWRRNSYLSNELVGP